MHNTPLKKIVLEWAIYPLETINIWFEHGLEFTSKIHKIPQKKT